MFPSLPRSSRSIDERKHFGAKKHLGDTRSIKGIYLVAMERRSGSKPAAILLLAILASTLAAHSTAQLTATTNPTSVLQNRPDFSTFSKLLTDTGVISEINQRSSLTLLVPHNSAMDAVLNRSSPSSTPLPLPVVADVLRYHCLLQYLDVPQIKSMTNELGMLVTSLYQTTGRAAGQNGFVNVSVSSDGQIHAGLPFAATSLATVRTNITQFPYNISYMQIDQALVPEDLGRPQAAASSILNLTNTLQRSGKFTTFLNLMQSTGFTAALATLPAFSLFVPTDEAFQGLPNGTMAALSPSQASSLMAYHTLPAYTSSGSLQRQNSLVQTVASNGDNQKFLIQVAPSGGNSGGVSLSTGVDTADVVSTIYDQPPTAAYSVNRVLLPKEIFVVAADQNNGSARAPSSSPSLAPALAPFVPPVASPIVPVLAPQQASSPQVGTTSAPPTVGSGSGSSSPAPVVDIGNLPPASGPGAASTDTNQNSAATAAAGLSDSWLISLVLAMVSKFMLEVV
ncbi:fasciclin-like arabinogalactan protein 8 [Selaginella moellendorffii]|uniref:fasciclin-like arabinogalactan protein 8 n=1 Tax=Selaginella moellendorffii TaxID=88036 RepID=UPI000D1CC186|nr:fasciclin-like arabinogalactan protein 8 [Selaginella moellendorffii]|eukprot:XP_024521802.1 fasciclin-like arabinogalactan protein 8 [Selaginella moellendorffii]